MWHWLLHILGIDTQASDWYDLWSGFGAVTMASAPLWIMAIATLRKHNCHKHRCWRIGRHHFIDEHGHDKYMCRHHHPLSTKAGGEG